MGLRLHAAKKRLVGLVQLCFSILRGRLPYTFFECSVKRGIRIEADRKSDVENDTTLLAGLAEKGHCMLNSVLVQVIEKAHPEAGVDHLRQMIDRTIDNFRESRQREIGT
jgi:hypothetical protein